MSNGETESAGASAGLFERRPWGWGDVLALVVWTVAMALFFRDALSMRRASFTLILPRSTILIALSSPKSCKPAGSRGGAPGVYCGMPLFSESQAGYLHPLKYLLYPWLQTWQAFNLDTILSVWLTGVGTYCWLRRHVGPAASLTGAAIFGASGYVWGHLIHTSMINALASVPLVIWGLESSWACGTLARSRPGRLGPGVPGLCGPPARLATDDRPGWPVWHLPRGHGGRKVRPAARCRAGHTRRARCVDLRRSMGSLERAARSLATRRRAFVGEI